MWGERGKGGRGRSILSCGIHVVASTYFNQYQILHCQSVTDNIICTFIALIVVLKIHCVLHKSISSPLLCAMWRSES